MLIAKVQVIGWEINAQHQVVEVIVLGLDSMVGAQIMLEGFVVIHALKIKSFLSKLA